MRVALIPTGRMEILGLPLLLDRVFPGHTFQAIGRDWGSPSSTREPFRGFTSRTVILPDALEWDSLRDLVEACVAVLQSGGREVFDYAVVLEDLELANRANPSAVTDAFSSAVRQHLARVPQRTQAILAPILRDRCSFHLAVPMTESWFFGDPGGLTNASVPATHLPPRLKPTIDPEDFQTDDTDYSADTGQHCTAWIAMPERKSKKIRPFWLMTGREYHPKAYISWLCRRPEPNSCSSYDPTNGGRKALANLDLPQVLSQSTNFPYLRSFIADLADSLGAWPVGVPQAGNLAPLTSIHTSRTNPVLRNL